MWLCIIFIPVASVDKFHRVHGNLRLFPKLSSQYSFFCGMHKNRTVTDPIIYPQYNGYHNDNFENPGHAWQASNPSEEPLSTSRGAWGIRLDHPSSFSFLSIFENLKRLVYRPPFASETHHFPSSFVRRNRSPCASAAGPSTARFLIMCIFWYTTSALSSNTGKAILEQFRYPVTLTIIQFGFVAFCCLLIMTPAINFGKLRSPTVAIFRATLPMGAFQVGGHMFSSMAISRIHVSTVHTIKVCRILIFPPLHCSNDAKGIVTTLHRRRVRTSLWGQILSKDLSIVASLDYRSHACIHLRCFRV